jgi:hypothetical protein
VKPSPIVVRPPEAERDVLGEENGRQTGAGESQEREFLCRRRFHVTSRRKGVDETLSGRFECSAALASFRWDGPDNFVRKAHKGAAIVGVEG